MVSFDKHTLDNGIRVIIHEDFSSPLVAMNILYNVGSKDEHPDRTGFAHLFEHLMFGGSANIPNYDAPLEKAGGQNNAFTTEDITNYYLTIPAANIETGFWLESDRMLDLAFSKKSLDVQRKVVIEEFKQRYLNQPYGDIWLLLRPLVFKVHPYRWDTIGIDISHIAKARMSDVKEFYYKFYHPNNAILVLSGNIRTGDAMKLTRKWFGTIQPGNLPEKNYPAEPPQVSPEKLTVYRDVPYDVIYIAYKICKRMDDDFYALDLMTEILSMGDSSRLYNGLVKEKKLFSDISAYLTGELDSGMMVVSGKLVAGVRMQDAENGIHEELNKLKDIPVAERELSKVKNKMESSRVFSEMQILNKAMNLAYCELLGDAGLINTEFTRYNAVTPEMICNAGRKYMDINNCSTLYYFAKKDNK